MTDPMPLRLPGRRIHLIGAGGAGMSALAKILAGLGYEVSGSDLKPGRPLEALSDLGIATWIGHRPEAMGDVDLVVASSAVPERDPEMRAARSAGVTVWMRPRLLEAATAWRPAIGLAGTHGKTTSTAMTVTALRGIGADPTFIVGGQMAAFNTGAHLGNGPEFVLEADEAFGTFRHLHLESLMVTNIEADHLDYYGSLAALEEAFALVARRVTGPVIACIDDPGVRRLGERVELITYGTDPGAAWRIVELAHGSGDVSFHLEGPAGETAPVSVPIPGAHTARNAAGVLALLASTGRDLEAAASGLAGFRGVRRRFDVRGKVNDITVVDDYAHHPTEIGVTIAAGRQGGWNRVLAVFQPHRYTRTANLGPAFGAPLAVADKVIVTEIYAADEQPIPGVTGKLVAEAVAAAGGDVAYVPALADVPDRVVAMAEPGDLVLLLGAGDITGMAEPLLAALGRGAS